MINSVYHASQPGIAISRGMVIVKTLAQATYREYQAT
jgi:hypothetical protein